MKIVLFDDHQFVIDSIAQFLSQKAEVEIVGTATRKNAVLDILCTNEVDILISDVLTDEEVGLGLFEEIKAKKLPTKVIVYSSITSEFVKEFLYEYGVVAFLNKKESLAQLWETIQLVDLNKQYKIKVAGFTKPPKLTSKEQEIAKYLAKGLAAKEIAVLTDSAVSTINNQKNNLLAKFDCTNSTELALKLIQMGYLKL